MKTSTGPIAIFALIMSLGACGQKYDINTDDNKPVDVATDTTGTCDLRAVQSNLKIFLMVDNSGSTDTTDPDQKVRVDTAQAFLDKYSSKTNFTYALGFFAGSTSVYDNSTSKFVSSPSTYFMSAADEGKALNLFAKTNSAPNTEYKKALGKVKDLVQADHSSDTTKARYAVIFMSDGQPTDFSGGDVPGQIRTLVKGITDIAPDSVTLSSVYFGPKDGSDALKNIANLQAAADEGGGIFLNTNDSSDISIDRLVSTKIVCK